MVKFIISFIILFVSYSNLYSQEIEYEVEHFGKDKINFDESILSIFKDKDGFIWIAVDNGIYKFDGYNFRFFEIQFGKKYGYPFITEDDKQNLWFLTENGIKKFDKIKERFFDYLIYNDSLKVKNIQFINTIYHDNSGNIWIGNSDGLGRYDTNNDKFIISTNIPDTTKNKKILSIYEDSYGLLWIAMSSGLYIYRDFELTNKINFENSFKYYIPFYEDRNMILWCGVENNLYRFDREYNNFEIFELNPKKTKRAGFICFYEDSSNQFWIGHSRGIYKFQRDNGKFYSYDVGETLHSNSKYVLSIFEDIKNNLWIGTLRGAFKYCKEIDKFIIPELLNTKMSEILKNEQFSPVLPVNLNSSNMIWLSNSNGLYKVNLQHQFFEEFICPEYLDLKMTNKIMSIWSDQNESLWLGTQYGGLLKLDLANNKYKRFLNSNRMGDFISSIYKNYKNELWLGTKYGIYKFDERNNHFLHWENLIELDPYIKSCSVLSISEDNIGNLLLGSSRKGFFVVDIDNKILNNYTKDLNKKFSLNSNSVSTSFVDKANNIWIGTSRGLFKFNDNTKQFYIYNFLGKKEIRITNITNGFNGNLWIGTSKGLFYLDRNSDSMDIINYFNYSDGLPSNYIKSVVNDNFGYLWIATEKGISIYDGYHFRNFTEKFKNTKFVNNSFFKNEKGEIFFGTYNGFIKINPNEFVLDTNIPNLVITNFKIFNKSLSITNKTETINKSTNLEFDNELRKYYLKNSITYSNKIELSYKENYFSFEFATLDYTKPEHNHYAYKMDGFDKDWIYCGNKREASYTNLDPGEYIFRVKGTNYLGVWNEVERSLKILITPPWWQTWWFRLLMALVFIGILYWIYKYRTAALRKKNQAQKEFSRKLIDSQEKERKRIASALHDSHGQNLLIISNEMQQYVDKHKDSKNELKQVTDTVQESINEIREISYNLHPHQLERIGLNEALDSMINKVSKSSEIQFDLVMDDIKKIFDKKVEINIYRIIQEAVNNIIKHSLGNEAKVEIKKNIKYVTISISDNGKGFDKNLILKENNGLGLVGMKERVNLINGQFKLKTEKGSGTRIEIRIPFKT